MEEKQKLQKRLKELNSDMESAYSCQEIAYFAQEILVIENSLENLNKKVCNGYYE